MSIAIPNYENKTVSNGFILRNLGAVKFNSSSTECDRTNFSYDYNDDNGYKVVENCRSKGYYNSTDYTFTSETSLQYFYIQLKYGGVIRWVFGSDWGGSGTPSNLFGINFRVTASNDFMGNGNSPQFTYLNFGISGKSSAGYVITAAELTNFSNLIARPTTAQMAERNTFGAAAGDSIIMGQGYCIKPQFYGFTTSMTTPNYMQLYYEVPFDKCFNYKVNASRYSGGSTATVNFNGNMHMQVYAWVPADQDVYIV